MTFENGLCISVAFGPSNYCERRYCHQSLREDLHSNPVKSKNAEIAIWNADMTEASDFQFEDMDSVKGWIKADEIAKWIFATSTAVSLNDIQHLFNSISENTLA